MKNTRKRTWNTRKKNQKNPRGTLKERLEDKVNQYSSFYHKVPNLRQLSFRLDSFVPLRLFQLSFLVGPVEYLQPNFLVSPVGPVEASLHVFHNLLAHLIFGAWSLFGPGAPFFYSVSEPGQNGSGLVISFLLLGISARSDSARCRYILAQYPGPITLSSS